MYEVHFAGTNQDNVGVFEYGNHGTVFLDETRELPPAAQGKLHRGSTKLRNTTHRARPFQNRSTDV